MLVGHVSRDIDINVLRENWERNYPVRHIDGLPDFIEITAGNIRMFYPTCYVYKIGSIDETNSSNESTPPPLPNKKSDISSTKKSKIPPSTTNLQSTSIDLITNNNKNENILIKNLSNQLLISAQRNNCIDIEKKYFVIFFCFFFE